MRAPFCDPPPLLISRSSKGEFLRSSKGAVFERGKSLKWQKREFFSLYSWENDSSWYYSKKGPFLLLSFSPLGCQSHFTKWGGGKKRFLSSLEVWKKCEKPLLPLTAEEEKEAKKVFRSIFTHTHVLSRV